LRKPRAALSCSCGPPSPARSDADISRFWLRFPDLAPAVPPASAAVNVRGYPAGSRIAVAAARLRRRGTNAGPADGEVAISITAGTLAYIDEFLPEDDALILARRNAAEIGGAAPVSTLTGGTLRFTAAAIAARSVVEIGTGCGTSGIWLLRGMRPGAVLTSVDVEPEHQRLARAAFVAAGFPTSRYRLIGGLASEVLPRLADGAYDLVFCDADREEVGDYLAAALRLLRPGGIVIFNAVLPGSTAAERAPTDAEASAAADLREQVRSDERLVPLLLPVGTGILAAVRQPG
jgi:predicted O-methyltransferase YrrM